MNNQLKFDPMTGQPLNNNVPTPEQPVPTQETSDIKIQEQVNQIDIPEVNEVQIEKTNDIADSTNVQQQMQTIPTVGQDMQEFINNTQSNNEIKKEDKKESPNIILIVIVFVVIFAAIFFLFPYLLSVLG